MMKIVRKCVRTHGGLAVEVDCAVRGPFLTETTMKDGPRARRLVVTLHGNMLQIRYARSTLVLCAVGYDALVKQERARTYKLSPKKWGRK